MLRPIVAALVLAGCYGSHPTDARDAERIDASLAPGPRDAGLDAPVARDAAHVVGEEDADVARADAHVAGEEDAAIARDSGRPSSRDGGAPWNLHDCAHIALTGSILDGEPCDGPFHCGIYDCACSRAMPICDRDGVLRVNGWCNPAGCARPGAWESCEQYVAEGGEPVDHCDPRSFETCIASAGECTREIGCHPLDGWVVESLTCP